MMPEPRMMKETHCTNESITILSNFNADICKDQSCSHFNPTTEYPHTTTLRTIVWINWSLSFVITFLSVLYIYQIWIKEKRKIEGWPWLKSIYGIKLVYFKWMPRWFVGFGLVCKLLPSLTMDVIDILTDTLYFNLITQACGVLDTRLHTPKFVFHVLFIFMVAGMIKNIVVTRLAYKQLTKKLQIDDLNESDLVDSNAYMALTFFQGVLAFVFQDAAAAMIQFFYIDKYVTGYNTVAIINAVIMFLFASRVLYVFIRYIIQYWDKTDALKLKVLHVIMLCTKAAVFTFHMTRNYAVVLSKIFNVDQDLVGECFHTEEHHGILKTVQNPFASSCLTVTDKVLISVTIITCVGVLICTVLLMFVGFEHFKIFNQSHYSGRVGNISAKKLPAGFNKNANLQNG